MSNITEAGSQNGLRQEVKTDAAPQAIGPYSQAIRAGDLIFCSGQIPLDPKTGEIVSEDVAEQTKAVLSNLMSVISAGGGNPDKIVKTTIFLSDLNDFSAVNDVYANFFQAPYPARATVQVARLPMDVRVEIDAIAKV